jgi:hypothetical protein
MSKDFSRCSTQRSWSASTRLEHVLAHQGRSAVAELGEGAVAFSRVARFAQPALADGGVGLVFAPGGRLFRILQFTITRGKIVKVDVVADLARL